MDVESAAVQTLRGTGPGIPWREGGEGKGISVCHGGESVDRVNSEEDYHGRRVRRRGSFKRQQES